MAWQESKFWLDGSENMLKYQEALHEALTADERNSKRKKVVHPNEMPWELAPQGILKHLINEQMNTRMETVDAYMQIIPPGSRSGKHRHLAEECLYVLEGFGYDLHQDCDVEITDTVSRDLVTTSTKTVTLKLRTPTTGRPKTRLKNLSGRPGT